MLDLDERLKQKCILESDLPPVQYILWGLDDASTICFDEPFTYNGHLYQVSIEDNEGNRHEDWVAAKSPKEALDILADNVEAWFRNHKRPCPNLYKARASQKFIERFNLEADEVIRLGKAKLAFVDGLIVHMLFRFGWELPKNWQFKLP